MLVKTIRLVLSGLLWLGLSSHLALASEMEMTDLSIRSASLSPDGKHVAMLSSGEAASVFVLDIEQMKTTMLLTPKTVNEGFWRIFKYPRKITWVTNELLAVDFGVQSETFTLNGKRVAQLGESENSMRVVGKADPTAPDSSLLLVNTDLKDNDLALIDGRTGKKTRLHLPGGKPIHWAFDHQSQLRALTTLDSSFWSDATRITNWYKANATAEWEKLAEFKVTDEYWAPLFVPEQENSLIIFGRNGRDTRAVFRYDIKKRQVGEFLAGHPTEDIYEVTGIRQSAFESIRTDGMVPQQIWFDSRWSRVQGMVDQALPKRVNFLSGNPKSRVLVFSYADVDPGTWYFFDIEKLKLIKIAENRPKIKPETQRPMDSISYPARDGLAIHAYLTKPAKANGPSPTIVLLRGGPLKRDEWEWDEEIQWLAKLGYTVFQPLVRGSTGFGKKFRDAGNGQWGLAMQDDITDGVAYLVKQGIADPKRICIYGEGYGGYAALWGLVKTPELYRCGISFGGFSDFELWFDNSRISRDKVGRELFRGQIGDIKQDRAKFDQISPLKNAARIVAPVLLMHRGNDERVLALHSEKMKTALEKNHKVFEWVSYGERGQRYEASRIGASYDDKLEAFLKKYLAPEVPESPAPPAKPVSPATATPPAATNGT
jgi:dipeptidyl aminopeptidase/acylaminoacyl peptidase